LGKILIDKRQKYLYDKYDYSYLSYFMKKKLKMGDYPEVCGVTSLGERGQIVIPKEARAALKIKTGDSLVALVHNETLIFVSKKKMESYIKHLTKHLKF